MNQLKRTDFEIMAPVGSYESLMAAFQGKADAVYLGVGRLNMRSKSTHNFTPNDLKKIVDMCNERDKKVYVTLNTVMYDDDLDEMRITVDACAETGVHAIIASDQAVLEYARTRGVEIHISTQQNISNVAAVKFFSKYADVVVLARELNMQQVKHISNTIVSENIRGPKGGFVKIEMFAHGALCMAVSGKCYLSLHAYNKSANRGACNQICRRSYTVTDNETKAQLEIDNEYIMSPKDLCTIHFINKLADAGVRVLKIEGRARSAEYVKTVCECYNEAVEALCHGMYDEQLIGTLMQRLNTVYNRGYWDGYYLGQRLGEWSHVYGSKATKKKVYIGKALNYFSQLKVAEFQMEAGLVCVGDDIVIIGPTTGVTEATVKEIRVDLCTVEKAVKGERFSMPSDVAIRRSDKLYKLVTDEAV